MATSIDFETIKKTVDQHETLAAAARALQVPRQTLVHAVKEKRAITGRWPNSKKAPPDGQAAQTGRSLDEFRETYDKSHIIPKRIREALKALNGGWEYEQDLCRLAGVSLQDLSNFRSMFEEHVVVVKRDGKRAWAGTPAAAQKMREMLSGKPRSAES